MAGVAGFTVEVDAGCSTNCAFDDGVGVGVGDWRSTDEFGVGDAMPDNLNLEGDRERDLRRDLTVEPTSTW